MMEAFHALCATQKYLHIDDLEDGMLYLIHARNSYVGVWDATTLGFVILREKFGARFLTTEFHYDHSPTFGTAKPLRKISGPVAAEMRRAVIESALNSRTLESYIQEARKAE